MQLLEMQITEALNNTLSGLENHEKEYLKLYRAGKIELEKLLEFQKKEIYKKILELFEKRKLFDIWRERIREFPANQKDCYIQGYNKAVQEVNENLAFLKKLTEKDLENIL